MGRDIEMHTWRCGSDMRGGTLERGDEGGDWGEEREGEEGVTIQRMIILIPQRRGVYDFLDSMCRVDAKVRRIAE